MSFPSAEGVNKRKSNLTYYNLITYENFLWNVPCCPEAALNPLRKSCAAEPFRDPPIFTDRRVQAKFITKILTSHRPHGLKKGIKINNKSQLYV